MKNPTDWKFARKYFLVKVEIESMHICVFKNPDLLYT
jgi:hypothetical protein